MCTCKGKEGEDAIKRAVHTIITHLFPIIALEGFQGITTIRFGHRKQAGHTLVIVHLGYLKRYGCQQYIAVVANLSLKTW